MSLAGDAARVSVKVAAPPDVAFRVFVEDIDQWWRRGRRFRASGPQQGFLLIEPGLGGRLIERWESGGQTRVIQTGEVTEWSPPARLVFRWRNVNFRADEATTVAVDFAASGEGTLVTVTHSGWAAIRPDHPARHGLDDVAFLRMMGLWWGDLLRSLRERAV